MGHPRYEAYTRTIPIANPAVGTEYTISPTDGGTWIVRSLAFVLTTSAVVATRLVALTAGNGSELYYVACSSNIQTASNVHRYSGWAGSTGVVANGGLRGLQLPTDGIWLPQGHTLATLTDAIDAGDQFSSMVMLVDVLPHGAGRIQQPLVHTFERES